MTYQFPNKKSSGGGVQNRIMLNQELAQELHKPIIKKFEKRKIYWSVKGNICVADMADTQQISKLNKEFQLLICAMDIYSKYAWVVPLKNKKWIAIYNFLPKILYEFNRKLNKRQRQ